MDAEYDRALNALIAKVGALRLLVTQDIASRWSREAIEDWCELTRAAHEKHATPSELGRAQWLDAIDQLALELRRHVPPPSG